MNRKMYQVYCLNLSSEYTMDKWYIGAGSIDELRDYLINTKDDTLAPYLKRYINDLKCKKTKLLSPVEHLFTDVKLQVLYYECY